MGCMEFPRFLWRGLLSQKLVARFLDDLSIGAIVRRANNPQNTQIILNGLINDKSKKDNSAGNFHGRQIKNTAAGTDPTDVVIVSQLHSAMQGVAPAPVVQPVAPKPTGYFGTAILPGLQLVATDVLANRYIIKMPQDSSGASIFTKVTLQAVTITVKVAGISVYTVMMLVSTDSGSTFSPLFGVAGIALPPATRQTTLTPGFLIPTLVDGNEIRVDVLVADGVVSGAEILLQGVYS